jgi:hypothetical protein
MKRGTLLLLSVVFVFSSKAQILHDVTLDRDFAAQVKSMDEFVMRFNGMEGHPDLQIDTTRTKNLIALFDYQMSHAGMSDTQFKQHIQKFVQQVEQQRLHITMNDAGMYAEVTASATIDGKAVPLTLIMQQQTYNGDQMRWAIVGAKGLVTAGIIDTTRISGISPVEHELHFMSIGYIFEHDNCFNIMSYKGTGTKIDEFSVLLALAMADKVRITQVSNLTIHCMDVPGYTFTINETGRRGNNSGWLISSLTKMNDEEKNNYLKQLFGL